MWSTRAAAPRGWPHRVGGRTPWVIGSLKLVDDKFRKRLALDILGNDEKRLAGLHDCFED
jgi:hypothetical protein